jgi:hypothetical protein
MNLVTPKAGAKHGLLFNKPASGVKHSPGKNWRETLILFSAGFHFVVWTTSSLMTTAVVVFNKTEGETFTRAISLCDITV